jgi:hypothetical protein
LFIPYGQFSLKGGEPQDNMAEDTVTTPTTTPVEDKSKQTEATAPKVDNAWADLAGGKFKSPEDLAKAYRELESKFGSQSEEVRQAKEFATVVQPLLEEIRSDPKLFDELDSRLRRKTETPKTPDKETPKQDDVRNVTVDLLINRFEDNHKLGSLPEEERKDLRKQIGDKVYELTGQPLTEVDLRRLSSVMENAFKIVKNDAQGSKLEALLSANSGNEGAALSGLPSSGGKSETTATPEETHTAERLGLTREQYLDGKKKLAKV